MGLREKPFYWYECDGTGHGPGVKSSENAEYEAWSTVDDARQQAEDAEWVVKDSGQAFCLDCAAYVCRLCDTYDAHELPGERDYMCVPCALKSDDPEIQLAAASALVT